MGVTRTAATLGAFALVFGVASAHAQTSTLEPFVLDAQLAVGTLAGRRPLTMATIRLSGPLEIGAVPSFMADDASTPEPLDARVTALLQRDYDGALLTYQVTGQYAPQPRIWFQNNTRWIEPMLPGFKAPAQGGLAQTWFLDGLCSVAVAAWSGDPDMPIKRLILKATSDTWASGFEGAVEGTGPLQQSEGFLRTVVDGLPVILGELLLPPGASLLLEVEAVYEGDYSTKKTVNVRANPQRCASDPTPQPLPVMNLPPPAMGRVESAFRLLPDPAVPPEQQPKVSFFSAVMQPGKGMRFMILSSTPDPVDGVARRSEPGVAGVYTFDLSAVLTWPDGLNGRLVMGHDVAGARFSPVVPVPLSAGPQKGFYPDLSIVVSDSEVESLVLDDVYASGEGGLSPYGCMTASDVESGEASWETTAPMPASILNEIGIPTSDEPFPSMAYGPIVPGTDRYRLAALAGQWRESGYLLRFRRPPAVPGESGVHADFQWKLEPSLASVASWAPGAPLTAPSRALPVGAVTVTLRVQDASTGRPRAFMSPEVTIFAEGGPDGDLTIRAYGDQEMREVHRVLVPSLPGRFDVAIKAYLPQDPADPGAVIVTALPTLRGVPFRAPRPDGSCAAICNDPGTNVYWDDDLAPPTLELDDVPMRVYEPFVDVTGEAFDESPIVRVQAGDAVAMLDGDDTSPRRAFTLRVPVDEHTREVTVLAQDRCGGEVKVTRPVSLWSNTPPAIGPLTVSAREGELVEAPMSVVDPDASDARLPQPLAFSLEIDEALPGVSRPMIDPATGLLSWTPGFDQSGTWTFRVTVSDGVASDDALVVVEVAEVNRPPVIERVGAVPVTALLAFVVGEGERLELKVDALDPDGDEVSFAASGLEVDMPAGLSMSPDGLLTWTPGFDQRGDYVVEVAASDGRGGEDRQTLFLRVGDVNRPPVIEGPGFRSVAEGEPLDVAYLASDPDGQTLTWSVEPLDLIVRGVWLDTSGDTARLRWKPGYDDAGDYLLTVTVTDTEGVRALAPLVLQVTNTNRPPTFAPVSPPVAAGWPGGFVVVVHDPDGQEVTCVALQLPEGVAWDAERRRVSWEDLLWPEGPVRVTISCSDGEDESVFAVDVKSEHFELVGGCDCAGAGTGSLALLALVSVRRRRRPR